MCYVGNDASYFKGQKSRLAKGVVFDSVDIGEGPRWGRDLQLEDKRSV